MDLKIDEKFENGLRLALDMLQAVIDKTDPGAVALMYTIKHTLVKEGPKGYEELRFTLTVNGVPAIIVGLEGSSLSDLSVEAFNHIREVMIAEALAGMIMLGLENLVRMAGSPMYRKINIDDLRNIKKSENEN